MRLNDRRRMDVWSMGMVYMMFADVWSVYSSCRCTDDIGTHLRWLDGSLARCDWRSFYGPAGAWSFFKGQLVPLRQQKEDVPDLPIEVKTLGIASVTTVDGRGASWGGPMSRSLSMRIHLQSCLSTYWVDLLLHREWCLLMA